MLKSIVKTALVAAFVVVPAASAVASTAVVKPSAAYQGQWWTTPWAASTAVQGVQVKRCGS